MKYKRAAEIVHTPRCETYRSFSVSWHRKTSGVEITPQCLNLPSPMERDTSTIPIHPPTHHTLTHTHLLVHDGDKREHKKDVLSFQQLPENKHFSHQGFPPPPVRKK